MSNYGDKHFNNIVFDYFPWYSYGHLTSLPEVNRSFHFYRISLSQKNSFQSMVSPWYSSGGSWISGNAGFSSNISFMVNPLDNEMTINGNKYTVEDWHDVEKLRLITILGLKSKSDKYLNFLDSLISFYEVLEDAELDCNKEFDYSKNCTAITVSSLMNRGYDVIGRQEDKDIINFIKNYSGSVEFYNSLKNYLTHHNGLTSKQIEAVRKKPSSESLGVDTKKLALFITSDIISGLVCPRFKNMGYKIKNFGDTTIVF